MLEERIGQHTFHSAHLRAIIDQRREIDTRKQRSLSFINEVKGGPQLRRNFPQVCQSSAIQILAGMSSIVADRISSRDH